MKNKEPHRYDVRLMALKRWNSPQAKSIYENKNIKHGDFVSFRSYHFIDILDVSSEYDSTLASTYDALTDVRNRYQDAHMQDTHIVQTMPILGQKNSFWDADIDVLYITFIQLSSFGAVSFQELNNAIHDYLSSSFHGKAAIPQFALYQSLDFCDYILFTRDIPLAKLQDLLWDLALKRDICQSRIRDTFTICSFGWEYLYRCFQNPQYLKWHDAIAATINVSLESMDTLKKLREHLDKEHITVSYQRTCGRFDLSIRTGTLPGERIIRIIQMLDSFHLTDKNASKQDCASLGIGGYEIIFSSEDTAVDYTGAPAKRDTELSHSGIYYLDTWNKVYGEDVYNNKRYEIRKIANYIMETICSLKELLVNGFADEFVLCVMPSFVEVLNISLSYSKECIAMDKQEDSFQNIEQIRRIEESLHRLWRNYFTALNTLSLCTMHSERQFIQAPSFHASYFEVPPKLLVYYNAIVDDIVKTLNTGSATYHFVIAPDFRGDINVTTLPIADQLEASEHIAIINLNEAFFYNPAKATFLLCHEAAHFVGDRNRKLRASLIFKAVYLKLFQYTVLFNPVSIDTDYHGEKDIIVLLCDVMGEFLFELYENTDKMATIPYHSKNIDAFLKDTEYGLTLLRNPALQEKLKELLVRHLQEAVPKTPVLKAQFAASISSIEETLQTGFYSDAFLNDATDKNPYILFSGKVIQILKELDAYRETPNGRADFETIYRYLDETVCAFFEAYADFKMFELCGATSPEMFNFSCSTYEELLRDLTGSYNLQFYLRHESVLKTLFTTYSACEPNADALEAHVQSRLVGYISEYLKNCVPMDKPSAVAQDVISVFTKSNLQEQYSHINRAVAEYRRVIIEMCAQKSVDISEDLLSFAN